MGDLRSQQMTDPLRQKPVGYAGVMPGTTGFTMVCFQARDVPVGTALYTAPPASGDVRAAVIDALEFYADPFAWKKKNDSEDVVRVPDFYSETSFGDTAVEALGALSQSPATDAATISDDPVFNQRKPVTTFTGGSHD